MCKKPPANQYRCADLSIPVPPAFAGLVRSGAHFATVLRHFSELVSLLPSAGGLDGEAYVAARGALRRLETDLHDDEAAAVILATIPPRPCRGCGRPFLATYSRMRHCSDQCRRAYALAREWEREAANGL